MTGLRMQPMTGVVDMETLELRTLNNARGRRGYLRLIGAETRTEMSLVEKGDLFQEIVGGEHYRFTLSRSGQRRLDSAEIKNLIASGAVP